MTETIPLVRLQLPPLSSHSHELSVPILFHACHQNKSHRKGIMDSHRHEVRKCTRCGASKLAVVVHRRRPAFQVIQQKVIEHSKGKHGLRVDEGCRKESCPEELYVWPLGCWTLATSNLQAMYPRRVDDEHLCTSELVPRTWHGRIVLRIDLIFCFIPIENIPPIISSCTSCCIMTQMYDQPGIRQTALLEKCACPLPDGVEGGELM